MVEFIQSIFYDHSGIKLDIKKIEEKVGNVEICNN